MHATNISKKDKFRYNRQSNQLVRLKLRNHFNLSNATLKKTRFYHRNKIKIFINQRTPKYRIRIGRKKCTECYTVNYILREKQKLKNKLKNKIKNGLMRVKYEIIKYLTSFFHIKTFKILNKKKFLLI